MKKMWRFFQRKSGYIGLETVITAGLIFLLAAWAWTWFIDTGKNVVNHANQLTLSVLEIKVKE